MHPAAFVAIAVLVVALVFSLIYSTHQGRACYDAQRQYRTAERRIEEISSAARSTEDSYRQALVQRDARINEDCKRIEGLGKEMNALKKEQQIANLRLNGTRTSSASMAELLSKGPVLCEWKDFVLLAKNRKAVELHESDLDRLVQIHLADGPWIAAYRPTDVSTASLNSLVAKTP
jgi:hypothetical protein